MSQSIRRRCGAIKNTELRFLMDAILADLTALRASNAALVADISAGVTRANSWLTSSAGLEIDGGSKTARCALGFTYIANSLARYKAPASCSALVGTCADGKACAWVFYIDSSGTITTSAKTPDVTTIALAIADAIANAVPAGLAVIGYLAIINSGGQFVGGSTDLSALTVTPKYHSIVGPDKAMTAITATTPTLTLTE